MKLSSNSIGMLIFITLATIVFVIMALRPAVDGNAINLGVPILSIDSTSLNAIENTVMTMPEKETVETETDNLTKISPETDLIKDETVNSLKDEVLEESSSESTSEEVPTTN